MISRKDVLEVWGAYRRYPPYNKFDGEVVEVSVLRRELKEFVKELREVEEEYARDFCPVEVDDMLALLKKRVGLLLKDEVKR